MPIVTQSPSPYSLNIIWDPGAGNPLAVYLVKVNDKVVLKNTDATSSPTVVDLEAPVNGKFKVRWALAAEMATPTTVSITIGNNKDSSAVVVVDNKTGMSRGPEVWMGEKVVDAP